MFLPSRQLKNRMKTGESRKSSYISASRSVQKQDEIRREQEIILYTEGGGCRTKLFARIAYCDSPRFRLPAHQKETLTKER